MLNGHVEISAEFTLCVVLSSCMFLLICVYFFVLAWRWNYSLDIIHEDWPDGLTQFLCVSQTLVFEF